MMNILAIKSTGDTTSMSVILQNEINTYSKGLSSQLAHMNSAEIEIINRNRNRCRGSVLHVL